ncbi:MAG TPA: hypothetical protein PLI09_13400 [Candidatus Hydrogenedentes bacterium]|nr:hypothetical protein [Candidatus Hydrogenedentota bacterium]
MRCVAGVAVVCVLLSFSSSVWAASTAESLWSQAGHGHAKVKAWLYKELAGPMSEEGFKQAPVVTFWAGWDFADQEWKLNEYTNQMGHTLVGALSNGLFGRLSTLCIAVGTEIEQYYKNDKQQLKLADRLRDVLFYLVS